MTSVEPGVIDTNVLVYAMDADHPHHAATWALLDAARNGSTTLYVTAQILCEFYSIVTNPRRVLKPRSPAEAVAAISGMLALLQILPGPARVITTVIELLQRHPVTSAGVFDVLSVSTMQTNDVRRIYTFNTADFEVFPELTVVVPVAY